MCLTNPNLVLVLTNFDFTPEQLAEMIQVEEIYSVREAIENLGFKVPQQTNQQPTK